MKKQRDHSNQKTAKRKAASVESDILEALGEFTEALKNGDVARRLTCRQIQLDLEPAVYDPQLVKKTRRLLKVSQTLFARFLGVSPQTVRSWEQGINTPSLMACRFMDEIRHSPDYWIKRLQAAVITEAG